MHLFHVYEHRISGGCLKKWVDIIFLYATPWFSAVFADGEDISG